MLHMPYMMDDFNIEKLPFEENSSSSSSSDIDIIVIGAFLQYQQQVQ